MADTGDVLATDSEGYLYIKKSSDGSYLPIVSSWGDQADFDESGGDSYYSYAREAQYVEWYETQVSSSEDAADNEYYYIAVRVNNTDYMNGSPSTNEGWDIYKVGEDGTYDDMNTIWGVKIQSYEKYFGQDIDGDGSIGVNISSLETITTDTSSTGGILKRGGGSLFISDGSQTLQITDDYGYSELEYSSTWDGGAYSSTGYAVEKQSDGKYLLAIKNLDQSSNRAAWDIYELTSEGKISWDNYTFTTSVSSYEPLFNQDLNMDGHIGANLGLLSDVSGDTSGYRLKVDSEGSLYIWDGSNTSSLISVSDEYGGTPSYNWSYGNEGDDYYSSSTAEGVYRDTSNSSDIHYKVAIKNTYSYTFDGTTETDVSWEILKVSTSGYIDYSGSIYTDSITSLEDELIKT